MEPFPFEAVKFWVLVLGFVTLSGIILTEIVDHIERRNRRR